MNLKMISYCILVMGSMKGVKVTSQCVVKDSRKVNLPKLKSKIFMFFDEIYCGTVNGRNAMIHFGGKKWHVEYFMHM